MAMSVKNINLEGNKIDSIDFEQQASIKQRSYVDKKHEQAAGGKHSKTTHTRIKKEWNLETLNMADNRIKDFPPKRGD